MNTVDLQDMDGVAVVRLNRGKKNPINPEFVGDLSEVIEQVREDGGITSAVLTSSNDRFFSIGLDVPELIDYDKTEFREFIMDFNLLCLDIYTLPKPTAAAINGHAIAGGCILALCCDFRYMSEGKKLFGLNEVKLGVSVPYLPQRILQQIAGDRVTVEMVYGGDFYPPEKVLEMGVVDGVFAPEELLQKSVERVKKIGELPGRAFAAVKANRTERVREDIIKRLERDVDVFVELWFSDEAQQRLREAMKSF
ncbi:enoyl-CoA hydratase/isomerase family protein [Geoglobus acetivorans]|uniref:Enoyl-CoA hydratase n=1 Tax=Geoglobus acetivorans TaxID=565033 RepID=A0A0A7GEU8_GEOAI|nr:Enoyl-CoA hydratase [Geoglobus acetivorans]